MKKLSKFLISLFFSIVSSQLTIAQCIVGTPPISNVNPQAVKETKNGYFLPGSGTIRVLVAFVEVNYDNMPDPYTPSAEWPVDTLPVWANNLFDPTTPVGLGNGDVTRFFQQASRGNLLVLGDYLQAPTNGGVFKVLNSLGGTSISNVISKINSTMSNNIITHNGLNNVSFFDSWTPTNSGDPKTNLCRR